MIKAGLNKVKLLVTVLGKMSLRYLFFRISYMLQIKTGLLSLRFPKKVKTPLIISLDDWKRLTSGSFFFSSREEISIPKDNVNAADLLVRISKMKHNSFLLFSGIWVDVGDSINWHKNYMSGHEYPKNQHWSKIDDFSEKNGDIKFVWELSRFSFLYDFIRYDQYAGTDHSCEVLGYIENWIDENPLNQGPNYKCSQEMSLRLFNWTFALFYYRTSDSLTPDLFRKINTSIYNQYLHVCNNINFSRIAVRNNHAITETLAVWLIPYLFPNFSHTDAYKRKGKKWFEEEINYQIFDDGTYLQYSHNYHRVVIQLLTWAIVLSRKNKDELNQTTIEKADKSLKFLHTCQDKSGMLPNYGSNDGALFFPLSSTNYPDFSSQLEAFGACLGHTIYQNGFEDKHWYGIEEKEYSPLVSALGIKLFESEGYAVIREEESLTSMPCSKNTRRPFQADSLHLDIFHKGLNVFLDAGSYLYNCAETELEQFVGTQAHNTILINGRNQMDRIGRFVWKDWSRCELQQVEETETTFEFSARLCGFSSVRKGVTHTRKIIKYKSKAVWKVIDSLEGTIPSDQITINWHLDTSFEKEVDIQTINGEGEALTYKIKDGQYSRFYAQKQIASVFTAHCNCSELETQITIK